MGWATISPMHISSLISPRAGDFGDFTFSLSKADKGGDSGDGDLSLCLLGQTFD